jgi:predicted Abi (CAAX) family protease
MNPIPKIQRELNTFPGWKTWLLSFLGTALLLLAAYFALPGYSDPGNLPGTRNLLLAILISFFTPALFEELFFRVVINPTQGPISIGLSTAAFVAWHPIEAHLFLEEAIPWFTDPVFLLFVGIYGAFSAILRKTSGSLWPSILTHWTVVITWKGLGGAQFLT